MTQSVLGPFERTLLVKAWGRFVPVTQKTRFLNHAQTGKVTLYTNH